MGLNSKILALVLLSSTAYTHDFSYCATRYQRNSIKIDGHLATPIKYKNSTFYVSFSKTPIKSKSLIIGDDFIGLYSLRSPKIQRPYTLKPIDNFSATLKMANIGFDAKNQLKITPGSIKKAQSGFLDYGIFEHEIPQNSVITNICYQIYGIGVGADDNLESKDKFIDKEYLERFLSQAKQGAIYYGDIGIRIKNQVVSQVNPFSPKNPFKSGDKILKINNQEVLNSKSTELAIANAKGNVEVEILRNGKKIILKTVAQKRSGGFLLQDSFFESSGIKIDKDLNILQNNSKGQNGLNELVVGDKIKWIDGVNPYKMGSDIFSNIRTLLSDAYQKSGVIEMLVVRSGFEFKIKITPNADSKKSASTGFILLEERTSKHK